MGLRGTHFKASSSPLEYHFLSRNDLVNLVKHQFTRLTIIWKDVFVTGNDNLAPASCDSSCIRVPHVYAEPLAPVQSCGTGAWLESAAHSASK